MEKINLSGLRTGCNEQPPQWDERGLCNVPRRTPVVLCEKMPEDIEGLVKELKSAVEEYERLVSETETNIEKSEEARLAAENVRAMAERLRIAAEELRASAEEGRTGSEADRVEAERLRNQAESLRVEAERLRASAEQGRSTAYTEAEAARNGLYQTAEAARNGLYQEAETARGTAYTTAEGLRDDAFEAKEATRDAANQAALNCAETLSALGPKIDGETSEQKTEITKVEDTNFFAGKYINTAGTAVANPQAVEGFACMKIPCSDGDVFQLYGIFQKSAAVKLWVVIDSQNSIVQSPESPSAAENHRQNGIRVTIADSSAAYLWVNFSEYDASTDKVESVEVISEGGLINAVAELQEQMGGKQNTIQDLSTIRTNSQKVPSLESAVQTNTSDIAQLKSDIDGETTTIVEVIEKVADTNYWADNYFNTTGSSIIRPADAQGFSCMKIPCQKGDVFKVYGILMKVGSVKLWVVTDSSNNIIQSVEVPSDNIDYRNDGMSVNVTADGAAFLYVNFSSYDQTKDKVESIETTSENGIKDEIESLDQRVSTLENDGKKPYVGKTFVLFGDSITEFGASGDNINGWTQRWSDHFAELSGATVINCAIGGSNLRQRTIDLPSYEDVNVVPESATQRYVGLDVLNMVKAACGLVSWNIPEYSAIWTRDTDSDDNTAAVARLKAVDWSNVDGVIIMAGTNDWMSGTELTSATYPQRATMSAIGLIIEALLTTYPHVKLYWATPIVRYIANNVAGRTSENWSDNYVPMERTGNLKTFSNGIYEAVIAYKIPCCDMYNTLGWNQFNFAEYFRDNDSTHPYKGFLEIAKKILAFVSANNTI